MREKPPKCTFLCRFINLFVFSLFTRKHILNRQNSSRNSLIQVIKDALSAYLRTYHTPTLELKLVLKQTQNIKRNLHKTERETHNNFPTLYLREHNRIREWKKIGLKMFLATGHMQKWSVWSIVISMHQSKHASRNCANHKLTGYSLNFHTSVYRLATLPLKQTYANAAICLQVNLVSTKSCTQHLGS